MAVRSPDVPARPDRAAGRAVGRAAELRLLLDAAAGVRRGARVVWIGGEAGAGKTTLAEAAADALTGRGWRVVWGCCPEVGGAPPAVPWREVLASLGDDDAVAAVPPPGPFRLVRWVADRLRAATRGQPLLVVLDDLHRADELTLDLLRQVVDQLPAEPVLVLGTFRSTDDVGALAATRAALAAATAQHLPLGGLDRAAVAVLVEEFGPGDAGPELLTLVQERTGGNPLFVRELTRLLAAEGTAAGRGAVPAGVRDVLRRRVDRLPAPAVTALRQAAALGCDVEVDLLAAVTGQDVGELHGALQTAVLAGLLDEPAPGRVRFTHALVRDALYADLPLLRRGRVHAAALAALTARPGVDAAALAHHGVAAASPATAARALEHVVAAARDAERLGGFGDAARHWTTALRMHELAGVPAGGEEARCELLLAAVAAHARAGDAVTARARQTEAVRIARRLERDGLLAAALAAWDAPLVWTVHEGVPDPELLEPLLLLLETPAGEELADDVRCRLQLALFRELEGYDDGRAHAAGARALERARELDDPRLLCAALNVRAFAALGPDLAAQREPLAEELRDLAARTGCLDYEAAAHWLLFLAAGDRGEPAVARRHADAAVALSGTGQLGHLLSRIDVLTRPTLTHLRPG